MSPFGEVTPRVDILGPKSRCWGGFPHRHLHPQPGGWTTNPPAHVGRMPFSKGEQALPPGKTNRHTHSALVAPPPPNPPTNDLNQPAGHTKTMALTAHCLYQRASREPFAFSTPLLCSGPLPPFLMRAYPVFLFSPSTLLQRALPYTRVCGSTTDPHTPPGRPGACRSH